MREYIFWIVLGYLSGSLLFALWLPRWICHVDIRQVSEDKNPGTFNVFQHCGAWMGSMVLALEIGKAFLPVHMASQAVDMGRWPFALVLAAPVLGHAFPFWNCKKGGKSIAASFGSLLGLHPLLLPAVLLAGCYLLFTLVIVINPHSMRSIVTFAVWMAGCGRILGPSVISLGCFLIGVTVIGKHVKVYQGEKCSINLPFGRHRSSR